MCYQFLKRYIDYVNMCVHDCVCTSCVQEAMETRRWLGPLELDCELPSVGVGTKLRSPESTASTLKC